MRTIGIVIREMEELLVAVLSWNWVLFEKLKFILYNSVALPRQIVKKLLGVFVYQYVEIYHFISTNFPLASIRFKSLTSLCFFSLSIISASRES